METKPPSQVGNLVARAIIGLDEEELTPVSDNPTGWRAIVCLHGIASREVLAASLAACVDSDPIRRRVGAAVLGQLGHTGIGFEPVFTEERYQGLAGLLATEIAGTADPDVLNDACVALGHLRDPRAIPALVTLQNHADVRVRSGVVHGLSAHCTPEAIDGLIVLSSDSDEDVRDWSTFGLAQLVEADTPAIRAALHARLNDPCINARNEAIEGLATRGDRSVLPVVINELHGQVALPLLNAAISLASSELCAALTVAAANGLVVETLGGPYDLKESWAEAMRACGCRV